ncbi:MAG: imidazole glycerol phosphate synthase subunit HisH, partial [Bacteroidota bacterium]
MIAVINYNAGNVRSVLFALERLGVNAKLTAAHDEIRAADKVIFPGVGEANSAMAHLRTHGLDQVIKSLTQPVLAICIGQQLLCEYSEENDTPCLGIVPQKVRLFRPEQQEKVPHIGWNKIHDLKNGVFDASLENEYVYYVHSYYVEAGSYTTALTDYVLPFSAGLQKDNFYATQFHPEKSGKVGAKIL